MKKKLPYTINNSLDTHIRNEQARRIIRQEKKVLLADVESDLAKYCNISRQGILRIKRQLSIPSLPLAFRIANFFQVNITDIFNLVDKEVKNNESNIMEEIK